MKFLSTSLLISLVLPISADILTLKDGTKIDGTITKRTLEEYEVEVQVSKSRTEKKIIKRADVAETKLTKPAEAAFNKQVAGLFPVQPFTPVEEYEKRVQTIETFLAEHKISKSGIQAKKMLTELKTELAAIKAGGLRVSSGESGLLTAEQVQADHLGIQAHIATGKFESLVKKRSYIAALRQYEFVERDFFATQAQRKALPLMRSLTATYANLLQRELNQFDAREERRMKTLERLSENDRRRAKEADSIRMKSFEKTWAKEEEEQITWASVNIKDAGSIEDTINQLKDESERLLGIITELEDFQETDKLYQTGWVAAGEKNKDQVTEIIAELNKAGIPETYINKLIERLGPASEMKEGADQKKEMMEKEAMEKEAMEKK